MSPHCLIISLGVLVTYICTIWFLVFFFSVHFLWSWLKRLSALKEAASFLCVCVFLNYLLNSWSNKRLFSPGLARPWGEGLGQSLHPVTVNIRKLQGLGWLGRVSPPPPSGSPNITFPCPGIWHCAHKQDSQDKQQAKLFVKPLWCILMREKQKRHLGGCSKEEVLLPPSWAPWEIWSLPQCFCLHFSKKQIIFFH